MAEIQCFDCKGVLEARDRQCPHCGTRNGRRVRTGLTLMRNAAIAVAGLGLIVSIIAEMLL
ncbi:MAG: hypothetical protein NVS4B3_10420 [Gemmatimonadaceae bacterium]